MKGTLQWSNESAVVDPLVGVVSCCILQCMYGPSHGFHAPRVCCYVLTLQVAGRCEAVLTQGESASACRQCGLVQLVQPLRHRLVGMHGS